MSMKAGAELEGCCVPGARPLARDQRVELAASFKALADPNRVAIVNRLAGEDELCVCDLVDEFELSQPTISHHLRILREAGLITVREQGTWAYYRLVPSAVASLARALEGRKAKRLALRPRKTARAGAAPGA
jgi:ArsR family transcriptional regulator, arsenate/arsenite/antimonite-responsive transcriptional repressor